MFTIVGNMGVKFVDVFNDAGLKRVPWAKNAPAWRTAIRGICLEGKCTTQICQAYLKQVIIGIGLRKFDLVRDADASTSQCPMCHKYVEPITCSFNNCDWRWMGKKQLPDGVPEKCSSGGGWKYADDAYHYFDESISGEVQWRQLLFGAREHQKRN